jgi:transcriptional regulator with XRE-family HTH domain
MKETVGAKMRRLREAHGWSQDHLARVSGVSKKTIGRVELMQTTMNPQTRMALAQALAVDYSELLEEEAEPPVAPAAVTPAPDRGPLVDNHSRWAGAGWDRVGGLLFFLVLVVVVRLTRPVPRPSPSGHASPIVASPPPTATPAAPSNDATDSARWLPRPAPYTRDWRRAVVEMNERQKRKEEGERALAMLFWWGAEDALKQLEQQGGLSPSSTPPTSAAPAQVGAARKTQPAGPRERSD